ncbi:hypothetical protein ABPG75_008974 [Micractinium tetrahymenae]
MANLLYQSLQPGLDEDFFGGPDGAAFAAAAAAGLNSADDSLPYSTSELNAPEYSTDEFRMFQFKVARCSKRYVHDWRACPFAHPTENARRRDPRLVKYLPVPCPDYKRGICLRGDSCTYSHGVYECWLHPAKYRTQLCKEGPNCRRPVCFFAHSVLDLRQPTHNYDPAPPGAEDVQASVAAMLAAQQQQQAAAAAVAARLSTDGGPASGSGSYARLSTDEVLNNLQDGRTSSDAQSAAASVAAILAGAASGAGAAASGAAPAAVAAASASPNSRANSLTRSSSKSGGSNGSGGSAGHSPDRAGSPNTPGQTASLSDLPAARSAEVAGVSDAAAAMAVLTQQQQAQAQVAQAAAAQAAATLARLSMDAAGVRGASLDASAAAATTQAMLAPRMSLDSLLATRQQQQGWAPGAPPSATTAAAALAANSSTSSLPLNEQPFPSGNAPRMSNAVARKLGLAPQRTSLDARLTKLRGGGVATPPRTSIDGILHALQQSSARSSLDQQQALLQQAMNGQQQLAMAGMGMNGYGSGMNGYGMPHAPAPPGYGMPPPGGGGSADMSLHPALLSLVAAQMQQQGPQAQMGGGPLPGMPPSMHSGLGAQSSGDANMAALHLMESINSWQLNGGGAPPSASMGQRASMDGMTGMAGAPAAGMPSGSAPAPAYYDSKGIWAASSQEAINNSAGADS